MYSYTISESVDANEWNTNLKKSDYANMFQTADYLLYESAVDGRTPQFVHVFDGSGAVIGQLGLIISRSASAYSSPLIQNFLGIFSSLGKKALWASGPIVHSEDKATRLRILEQIILALDEISTKNDLSLISGYTPHQDMLIDDSYKDTLKNHGYRMQNFLTYATSLKPTIDELWQQIEESSRRDVKKAQKRDLTVKEIENLTDVKNYFELGEKWAETKGISTTISQKQIEAYWEYYKKDVEKVFLAYEDGELVSSHRLGHFNKIVVSHRLTSSYSKAGSIGGPFLVWHAIQWAKNSGMRIYDFTGGEAPPSDDTKLEKYNKQWATLLAFKRKWGGTEYPYYQFVKVRNPRKYKIFRAATKIDWIYRNYKKNRYERPKKIK